MLVMQGLPSMVCGLDRSWSRDAATQPPTSPALLYSLSHLEEQLKAAYKLVTEGKFSDALKLFLRMLQVIPLMVVETRKEVDEVCTGSSCLLAMDHDYECNDQRQLPVHSYTIALTCCTQLVFDCICLCMPRPCILCCN